MLPLCHQIASNALFKGKIGGSRVAAKSYFSFGVIKNTLGIIKIILGVLSNKARLLSNKAGLLRDKAGLLRDKAGLLRQDVAWILIIDILQIKNAKSLQQLSDFNSWGTRTRTRKGRTRICSVTITPYPKLNPRIWSKSLICGCKGSVFF